MFIEFHDDLKQLVKHPVELMTIRALTNYTMS